MLQVKARADTKRGVRFMATICFYQDTRHEKPLYWIRERLGIGHISHRSDGMTELRINGFEQVGAILTKLRPFIRFKTKQVQALIQACVLLSSKQIRHLSGDELRQLVDLVFVIRNENYKSRNKFTKEELNRYFGLTP